MAWFDESARPAPAAPPPDPSSARRRRARLAVGLVACGVLLGLVVAAGVSAVGRYLDGATAAGPAAPDVARATAAPARAACGAALRAPFRSPERTVDLQVDVAPGADGAWRVTVALVGLVDATVRAASDVAVVAVADDRVVGRSVTADLRDPDPRRADPYRLELAPGVARTVEVAYPLEACDGGPLPPGEYVLRAGVVLSEPDGTAPHDVAGVSAPVRAD